MDLTDLRVQVHPGAGMVASFGCAVLVVRFEGGESPPLADPLLAVVEEVVDAGADAPGRAIARRVAGLLTTARPNDACSFCLVANVEEGVAIMLQGGLNLEIEGPDSTEHLSGRKVAAWIDRIIDGSFERLSIWPEGQAPVEPDDRFDLGRGIVPGCGLSLTVRSHEQPDKPIAMDQTAPRSSPSAPSAYDVGGSALVRRRPAEGEPAQPPLRDISGVQVLGIRCSRGHFGDPSSQFCAACGISLVHQTHDLVEGLRPSLGIAVLDDGSTYALDTDYVIGREPETDPHVREQRARPLVLEDPSLTISRVHARISLDEWQVTITDAGSANGTRLAGIGEEGWIQLAHDEPTIMQPGTRLLIGERTFVFELHHRQAPG